MTRFPQAYTAWMSAEITAFREGYRVPTERDLKWLEALQAADGENIALRRRLDELTDKLEELRGWWNVVNRKAK